MSSAVLQPAALIDKENVRPEVSKANKSAGLSVAKVSLFVVVAPSRLVYRGSDVSILFALVYRVCKSPMAH